MKWFPQRFRAARTLDTPRDFLRGRASPRPRRVVRREDQSAVRAERRKSHGHSEDPLTRDLCVWATAATLGTIVGGALSLVLF